MIRRIFSSARSLSTNSKYQLLLANNDIKRIQKTSFRWILFGFRLSKTVSSNCCCAGLFKGQKDANWRKFVDKTTDACRRKAFKNSFPCSMPLHITSVLGESTHSIQPSTGLKIQTHHINTTNAFNLRMWPSSANDNYNYRCVSSDNIGFCLIVWWVFSSHGRQTVWRTC